ncbi:MAG: hypothetical protein KA003_14635 [Caldilineaceae bacterium]|nr:hypothetical protein [Caldilineaceae bacterium]
MSPFPRSQQQSVFRTEHTGQDRSLLSAWVTARGARIAVLMILSLLWLHGITPFFSTSVVWAQDAGVEGAAKPDFVAESLEITQAIQDLNNSVRLVQDKRTFVRFHVSSDLSADAVGAVLKVEQGITVTLLLPLNSGRPILQKNPDRGVLDHAFLFELPSGFTTGTVNLTGYVNPGDMTARESDYTNNEVSTTVVFEAVPTINLVLYRLGYQLDGVEYWASVANRNQLADWLRRAYPVSDLRVWDRTLWLGDAAVNQKGELTNPTCASVNATLVSKKLWDTNYGATGVPVDAHYYGLMDDGGGFMRGCSLGAPFNVGSGPTGVMTWGWDNDGSYGDWYGAHELAHTFGRDHAGFCGAADTTAYPYAKGRISPTLIGADAIYGFDIGNKTLYSPAYKDLMTHCGFQWISDFTYEGLMDTFQSGSVTSVAQELVARRADAPMDRLLVTGSINPQTKTINLEPFFVIPNVGDLAPGLPGPYTIVLKDSQGQTLAHYPFTPRLSVGGAARLVEDGADDPIDRSETLLVITELVPYVVGTTKVEILSPDSASITGVTANPGLPQVTITHPVGGETFTGRTLSVNWTGGDADGDQLFYNVQYSSDNGQSWEMVAQGLSGTDVGIDLTDLAATQTGRMRVWATDGIHTTFQESAAFIIPNRTPIVQIRTDNAAPTVAVSQTITLIGAGYDVDTGPLPGTELFWRSNLDGELGTGRLLRRVNLSVGTHTITLRATDGSGASGVSTVQVTVVADVANLPAGSSPDGLVVGPAFLAPSIRDSTTPQRIYVTNKNSTRSVNWTAVSDQDWLVLEKTSGSTPDSIQLSVNWTSVNWTSVNWTSVNWTSVNWTSVNWTSVNWTGGPPSGELLGTVTITSPDLVDEIVVPVEVTIDPLNVFVPQLQR